MHSWHDWLYLSFSMFLGFVVHLEVFFFFLSFVFSKSPQSSNIFSEKNSHISRSVEFKLVIQGSTGLFSLREQENNNIVFEVLPFSIVYLSTLDSYSRHTNSCVELHLAFTFLSKCKIIRRDINLLLIKMVD